MGYVYYVAEFGLSSRSCSCKEGEVWSLTTRRVRLLIVCEAVKRRLAHWLTLTHFATISTVTDKLGFHRTTRDSLT